MWKFAQFLVILALAIHHGQAHAFGNSGQAFAVWPDTGLTACYGGGVTGEVLNPCPAPGQPFYGQDAQYAGPARSYTKLDIHGIALPDAAVSWAMVRDNVTGLTWEAKQADGILDYTNPHDADFTYPWCDSTPEDGDSGFCSLTDTEAFLTRLNEGSGFAGHTDWRLPTIKELKTLVDRTRVNPAISTAYFPEMLSGALPFSTWWSSTAQEPGTPLDTFDPGFAWSVDFAEGSDAPQPKNSEYHVRAVRGGLIRPEDRFVDNLDGTVTDTVTCLQWQQATADFTGEGIPDPMDWQNALAYAENLNLAGYEDWRLPNFNELSSIVDYSRKEPAINPSAFPGTQLYPYWSSTTSVSLMTYYAWALDFTLGTSIDIYTKDNSLYVRAVRDCYHFPWPMFLPAITSNAQR